MYTTALGVIITADLDKDPLYSLLLALLIFSFSIIDVNLVNSQAIDSLACSLNYGSFLHQELIGLIPVVPGMHIQSNAHTFFLKPEQVPALRQRTKLNIVHTLLISGILY